MLNQLHVVADARTTSGGEGLAAMRYAEAVARSGCLVSLISKYAIDIGVSQSLGAALDVQVVPVRRNFPLELVAQYGFIHSLCDERKFDLVHIHGVWSPFLAVAALIASRKGIPYIISPHGCLQPWALAYKGWKKTIALKVYQGAILRSASLFVATADPELESIRKLGLRQPIAVIPNGVDVGPLLARGEPAVVKTILFLSRIHPVKGLLDLVDAWALVRRQGWRIVIAGGDEGGYRAVIEDRIKTRGLQSDFQFVGFVDGVRKQACLNEADLFILPTHSENFGIAVAEALANELPVITTTGAPWQDLQLHSCGWWVNPGVLGVAGALREALESDQSELRQMGLRGRKLVLEKYSWTQVGGAALKVCDWVLNQASPKPETVHTLRS